MLAAAATVAAGEVVGMTPGCLCSRAEWRQLLVAGGSFFAVRERRHLAVVDSTICLAVVRLGLLQYGRMKSDEQAPTGVVKDRSSAPTWAEL